MKIHHEAKKLQENVQHFVDANSEDRYAFVKGILRANKWYFAKFVCIRVLLVTQDLFKPLLFVGFVNWLMSEEPDTTYTFCRAVSLALLIPLVRVVYHTIWEYFCFQMVELGNRMNTALKTLLFEKDLRMSAATNKDFSEGEVSSIIMDDTNRVWNFIWQLPEWLECPFILTTSFYFTYQAIGWYGFIVVFLTIAQFLFSYYRENAEKDIMKEIRENYGKRMLHINESFQNIKGIKLYGWENKFIDKIENIYQEENNLRDTSEVRNKVYDFVGGCLH